MSELRQALQRLAALERELVANRDRFRRLEQQLTRTPSGFARLAVAVALEEGPAATEPVAPETETQYHTFHAQILEEYKTAEVLAKPKYYLRPSNGDNALVLNNFPPPDVIGNGATLIIGQLPSGLWVAVTEVCL